MLQVNVLGQIDLAVAAYRAAAAKQAAASALLAGATRQEGIAQAMLEAGAISHSDLVAVRLQLCVLALARLDALNQVQQVAGQLEDAIQSPIGMPDIVWEHQPQHSQSLEGNDSL